MSPEQPAPSPARRSDPTIGLLLGGKYRIESVIADGGTSRVYRATQEPLGRPVAVKLLRSTSQSGEAVLAERLLREAAAAAALRHPNVVVIHDVGVLDDGRCYVVMELLEGRNLAEELRRGPMPPAQVIDLFSQVLRGLRHAHRAGFVHRDMKPANILLATSEDGTIVPKILDFGIVKQVGRADLDGGGTSGDEAPDLTQVGTFLGTPQYVSPEQACGHEPDPRADLYSVGVMLYRALCGKLPFERTSSEAYVAAHVQAAVPPMSERAPDVPVPPELEQIVRRCLEKSPDRRYPDADALRRALEDARRVVALAPVPDLEPSSPAAPTASTTLATPQGNPAGSRWKWGFLAVAGLLVVLCGGAGAIGLTQLGRDTEIPRAPEPIAAPIVTPPPEPEAPAQEVWLLLSSTPSGAEVWIGEESLGVTPLARRYTPTGDRGTFRLTLDGHQEATIELALSGEQVTADVKLEPLPKKPRLAPTSTSSPRPVAPPTPEAAALVADGVRFTSTEAAAALRWVNEAPYESLLRAGIAPRQARILADKRPFADLAAVAETPFIGDKTMESIRDAASGAGR
jgi:serine/threonine-protein kinase